MASASRRAPAVRPAPPRRAPAPAAAPALETPISVSDRTLLLLTFGLALGYFAFSFASNGFYQHDEVGHYVGMRQFWHDPSSALGNWAKPGYKLLYAPFALLGPKAVALLNSLVAAGCAFVATKAAQRLGVQTPLYAFVLLAFQPLWVGLAFRNYAELPTALLLALAVWAFVSDRHVLAALALGYAVTIRQELLPVWMLYGAWLLWRRQWAAVVVLPAFLLLVDLWGWAATGDPLHLVHATTGQGAALASGQYPRMGVWHYPSTVLVIFGAMALAAALVYAVLAARKQTPWVPAVLIPLGLYTAAHVAFQIQAVPIGPSTGGNLRYLTVAGPLLAILGAFGADRLTRADRGRAGLVLGGLALVTALFLSHLNNGITLQEGASAVPLLTVLVAAAALLLTAPGRTRFYAVTGAAVLTAILMVRPFPRTPEDDTAIQSARWYLQQPGLAGHPLYVSHPLFHYTTGKAPGDYAPPAHPATGADVRAAPPGSVIIWDSHYAYRPNQRPDDLAYTDLLADSAHYRPLAEPFVAADQSFALFAFEKR